MADVWALADDLQSKTGISMGSALTLLDPVALSAVSKAHVQVREGGRPRGGLYVTSKIVLPTSRQPLFSQCSSRSWLHEDLCSLQSKNQAKGRTACPCPRAGDAQPEGPSA